MKLLVLIVVGEVFEIVSAGTTTPVPGISDIAKPQRGVSPEKPLKCGIAKQPDEDSSRLELIRKIINEKVPNTPGTGRAGRALLKADPGNPKPGPSRVSQDKLHRLGGSSATSNVNREEEKRQGKCSPGEIFGCAICDRYFKSQVKLDYHTKLHENGKLFSCSICGKGFEYPWFLEQHMLWHSNMRPFACKLCHSSFKSKGNLKTHEKIHSDGKPFRCELCGKGFTKESALDSHEKKSHLEPKVVASFVCTICDKSFTKKSSLKRHESRSHSMKKHFKCTLCAKYFSRKDSLVKHEKKFHKGQEPSEKLVSSTSVAEQEKSPLIQEPAIDCEKFEPNHEGRTVQLSIIESDEKDGECNLIGICCIQDEEDQAPGKVSGMDQEKAVCDALNNRDMFEDLMGIVLEAEGEFSPDEFETTNEGVDRKIGQILKLDSDQRASSQAQGRVIPSQPESSQSAAEKSRKEIDNLFEEIVMGSRNDVDDF